MKEKKQKEKKKDNGYHSPLLDIASRFVPASLCMTTIAGFNKENPLRPFILAASFLFLALWLLFTLLGYFHKTAKIGDELTTKITRTVGAFCFEIFPLFLMLIFLIIGAIAELKEIPLNEYITAETAFGIVTLVYIASIFLYSLMVFIRLKKAGKDNGTQNEN